MLTSLGTLIGMLTTFAEQDEPQQEDVVKNDENPDKPRLDVSMYLNYVSGYFYERKVTPL